MSTRNQPTDSNTIKDADTWASGDDPITGAQASYLETLSEQAHEPPPGDAMTKAEASKRIDALRKDLQLGRSSKA